MAEEGPGKVAGVTEGQVLAGKYRVERVLGAGGMGVVVAAHHIGLDEKVAIKFLLPEMLSNAEAVNRFAREARNAVKIKGEHMARVFDVGTLETGAPYMVMEFLEGDDLHHWLQQRGPLPFEEAVDFVLQTCEVIAEAHSLGIIHRDLKPANLFCVRRADGRLSIKVLDFGISKVTHLGGSLPNLGMTSTGALMGSPFYMSPEQMESSNTVDTRTDIWALGVIIQELVTGKVPFPGATMPEVSIKVASRPPPPIREFRPDAPEGLQVVVSRCLEKDRERRYRNVAELAMDLLPFAPKRAKASVERISDIIQAAGLSASALSLPPSSEPTSPLRATETIAPFGGTASRTRGGRKTVFGVVATAALVIAAAIVFALVGKWRPSAPTERSTLASASVPAAERLVEPPPPSAPTAPPAALSPLPGIQEPSPEPARPVSKPLSPKPSIQTARPTPAATAAPAATAGGPVLLANGRPWAGLPTATATPAPATPADTPPVAATPAPPAAAKKNDCDPPTYADSNGDLRFKPECYGVPPPPSSHPR